MRWLAALVVFLALIGAAGAARGHRCGPGYIKRISLGVCVSKRSRLARGYVWVRAPRQYVFHRHHRVTFRERPAEVEPAKKGRLPVEEHIPSEDELLPIDKPAPEPEVELPLPDSLLLRKPLAHPFNWLPR